MDFMVAKNALKKKIQEAIQEATGPKSLKQRLSGTVQKLSQEQLDELQKQVDPSAHDKLITNNINALKDLSTQLQGAGRTETDTIEVNITTNKEELQIISEAGEEQLEAVNYLLEQSKRHIRARLATRPTQGSCGSRYAKFVVEKEPAFCLQTWLIVRHTEPLDQGWLQDKIADRPHHRLPEQFRDADFLRDEQPSQRVSSTPSGLVPWQNWSKVNVCRLQTRGRSFLANACFHTMLAHALGLCACSRTTGATVRTRDQCLAWEGSRDRITIQVWCCSCFLLDPQQSAVLSP